MAARAVRDGQLDFSTFTEQELAEALYSIDERKFPVNYARLNHELKLRGARVTPGEPVLFETPKPPMAKARSVPQAAPLQKVRVPEKRYVQRQHVPQAHYVPNKGPFLPDPGRARAPHLIIGSLMVGLGAIGIQAHPVLYTYAATACAAAGVLSVIASFFGEKGNEENYQSVATAFYLAAVALGGNALMSLT